MWGMVAGDDRVVKVKTGRPVLLGSRAERDGSR